MVLRSLAMGVLLLLAGCISSDTDLATGVRAVFPLAEGNYAVEHGAAYAGDKSTSARVVNYKNETYHVHWDKGVTWTIKMFPWPGYDGLVYQMANRNNFQAPAFFYGLAERDGASWAFLVLPHEDDRLGADLIGQIVRRDDYGLLREVKELDKALDALVANRAAMVLGRRLTPLGK